MHLFFVTDFTPGNYTLSFQSNLPICEEVMISDDDVLEDTETVGVALSSFDPDVNNEGLSSAIITISDNDGT